MKRHIVYFAGLIFGERFRFWYYDNFKIYYWSWPEAHREIEMAQEVPTETEGTRVDEEEMPPPPPPWPGRRVR